MELHALIYFRDSSACLQGKGIKQGAVSAHPKGFQPIPKAPSSSQRLPAAPAVQELRGAAVNVLLPSPGEPGKGWNCCEHPPPPTAILPGATRVPPAAYGRLTPASDALSVLSGTRMKIIHDLSHAFLPRRGAGSSFCSLCGCSTPTALEKQLRKVLPIYFPPANPRFPVWWLFARPHKAPTFA